MRQILLWLPALIWMIVIFSFSSQPHLVTSSIDWQDFIIRKAAHVSEYFVLTWLYLLPLRRSRNLNTHAALIIAVILALIYAASDEFHQTLILGREGRVRDVGIDSLGILLTAFFFRNW